MGYAEQLTIILVIAFSTLIWKIATAIAIENKGPRIPVNSGNPSWPVERSIVNDKEDIFRNSTFD